jgi:hypothetical protein
MFRVFHKTICNLFSICLNNQPTKNLFTSNHSHFLNNTSFFFFFIYMFLFRLFFSFLFFFNFFFLETETNTILLICHTPTLIFFTNPKTFQAQNTTTSHKNCLFNTCWNKGRLVFRLKQVKSKQVNNEKAKTC